jgi:acyl-coenzyme A synthetase/AMP-(fatty) acid ligase
VLLLTLDQPEMVYSFFGAIKIGAVPVPLNTLWKAADYEYVLQDSGASLAIVSAPLLASLGDDIKAQCPSLRHIVVVESTSFTDLVARGSTTLEPAPTTGESPAFWLYSSGSTGSPKACVHLQRDMRVCADAYAHAGHHVA